MSNISRYYQVIVNEDGDRWVPWVCDWDENSVRQSTPAEQARLTPKPEPLTPAIAKHLGFLG